MAYVMSRCDRANAPRLSQREFSLGLARGIHMERKCGYDSSPRYLTALTATSGYYRRPYPLQHGSRLAACACCPRATHRPVRGDVVWLTRVPARPSAEGSYASKASCTPVASRRNHPASRHTVVPARDPSLDRPGGVRASDHGHDSGRIARNRTAVAVDWIWVYLTYRRTTRLITETDRSNG
jgi:hypothetical protein